jgi:hypothetical protein
MATELMPGGTLEKHPEPLEGDALGSHQGGATSRKPLAAKSSASSSRTSLG